MKSSFFHIGVNRSLAGRKDLQEPYYDLQEPQVQADGSIPYVPLPDHPDPDFKNLTYGDPFGRLNKFEKGDIAWFIESGTINKKQWGYYLVAYFVVESAYRLIKGVRSYTWHESVRDHVRRMLKNPHEIRGDEYYDIVLGDREKSRLLFKNPLRLSDREDPYPNIRIALGLHFSKQYRGYWWKKWFNSEATLKLKNLCDKLQV